MISPLMYIASVSVKKHTENCNRRSIFWYNSQLIEKTTKQHTYRLTLNCKRDTFEAK